MFGSSSYIWPIGRSARRLSTPPSRRCGFFPGGGLSPAGSRWIACKPGFFLSVRVLSRLFRRLFLEGLAALQKAGRLVFFGDLSALADDEAFATALAPLRRQEWVVYAKRAARQSR
jgi:hypothetical protein